MLTPTHAPIFTSISVSVLYSYVDILRKEFFKTSAIPSFSREKFPWIATNC